MLSLFKNPLIIIKENIDNAKRTFQMSTNDLQKKYSGAALGVVWSIVRPMLFIFVYWFTIEVGIRGARNVSACGST